MIEPTVVVSALEAGSGEPVAERVRVTIRQNDDQKKISSVAAGASFLLISLLLVLLSGVPQLGISLMEIDFEGKTFRQLPVTRSLLIDKLLPAKSTFAPPKAAESPAHSVEGRTFEVHPDHSGAAVALAPDPPSQWQLYLISRLYRHNSSYI